MKRPMIACAAVCLGLCVLLLEASVSVLIILTSIAFCLLVILCAIKQTRTAAIVVAAAFLLLLSATRITVEYIEPLKSVDSDCCVVTATVTDVQRKEEYSVLTVRVKDSSGALPDGVKLRLTNYYENVQTGNEIIAEISVSGINESKYKKTNYSNGIFATGYITDILDKQYGDNIYHRLDLFKLKVSNIFFSNMTYEHATVAVALTAGESSYISDELYVDVRRSGVSHVLVVSGLHMAVVCGSIHSSLNRIKFNKQISAVLTVLFMIFFMALCGFTASVVRAGIMYGIFLLSRIFLQKRDGLNSLCIAVTFMLINNPFLIWNVGFLLSAAATGGIVILLPIFEKYIDKYVPLPVLNKLLKASAVTVSALITTLPISVYYYGEVSLVCVATNILISSAVSGMLIALVAGAAVCLIVGNSFIPSIFFCVGELLSRYMTAVITFFGNLKYATIDCEFSHIIIIYILIIAFFAVLKYTYIKRKRGV